MLGLVAMASIGLAGFATAVAPRATDDGIVPVAAAEAGRTRTDLALSARLTKAQAATAGWGTGVCNDLLPNGGGGFVVPGQVEQYWIPIRDEAIALTEKLYGITPGSEALHTTALVKARNVTRALMFAKLVKAVRDVHAGTATTDQINAVNAFRGAVKYGRKWMSIDAVNLWNAWLNSDAYQSTIANRVVQGLFGLIGLPWQNNNEGDPHADDLLGQAQRRLYGFPTTTLDGANTPLQNYPMAGAESAQALQGMLEALSFLNAVGYAQVTAPSGTDTTVGSTMAVIQNAIGEVSSGEMVDAVISLTELGSILSSGEGASSNAGVLISLVDTVWSAADSLSTAIQLNSNESKAFSDDPDLYAALGDTKQFAELLNTFFAMTLHPLPNAGGTGNDPDCRTTNKGANINPPPTPDGTFTVKHYSRATGSTVMDYTFTTQTMGGTALGTTGPAVPGGVTAVSNPSMLNWTYARNLGPGAPRMGQNWPISQITYGIPGNFGGGYGLRAPTAFYPGNGWWYLTFTGINGTPRTTAPLKIYSSGGTVHPTVSEVANAIVAADPVSFPVNGAPGTCTLDAAIFSADKAAYPCLDWNPDSGLGTALIVNGNNHDNNTNNVMDYMVIFDIMVKGDLGGWVPVFTAHGGKGSGQPTDCVISGGEATGGPCVSTLAFGFPLVGEAIVSNVIWPQQGNDLCQVDPRNCTAVPSYGWPAPYPVVPECQSVTPANMMFVIKYVGISGDCDHVPGAGTWSLTPSLHYRANDGNLWTVWRSPPTASTSNFLHMQAARVLGGQAGFDLHCWEQAHGNNAVCLQGQGTQWMSQFRPGDLIMLVDPVNGQNNNLGGLLSVTRAVKTVVDDTHIVLESSVECGTGTDGTDCYFINANVYTSDMNPANGKSVQYPPPGTISPCSGSSGCVYAPTNFRFAVYKLAAQAPGTTCPVWSPVSADQPPNSGCYFSDSIQFQAQAGSSGSTLWWNVSLPAYPPAGVPVAAKSAGTTPDWVNQPKITQQPASVFVNPGASATFTAAATGAPAPTVQWQQSTDSAATWTNVVGATNPTLTVNGATAAMNGRAYRAVFTNASGSRISRWARLGVYAAPQIVAGPAGLSTPQPGTAFDLTASASGVPLPKPTWQMSADGGSSWTDLGSGRSRFSLKWPETQSATALVRVIYDNDAGRAISAPAALGPTAQIPAISAKLDVDGSSPNTKYDALTDGLLVLRYLFGLTGTPLTNGALGASATRGDAATVKAYLDIVRPSLDIDGNGTVDALTDGLLIVRSLFGLTGNSLINGAIGGGATRTTPEAIQTYLQTLMP